MKQTVLLIAGIMCVSSFVTAATVVETWSGGTVEGWTADDAADGSGGSPYAATFEQNTLDGQEALRIVGGGATGVPRVDYIFADNGATQPFISGTGENFGSHTALGGEVQGLSFDFYANANDGGTDVPAELRLYFYSSTSGRTWYHNITGLTAGWNTYGANMSTAGPNQLTGTWYHDFGGSEAEWQADIQDVDYIGLYLGYRSNVGSQEYGLDNFTLNDEQYLKATPEPGTLAMLAMAFGSLGVTFRRKLRETMTSVKDSLAA